MVDNKDEETGLPILELEDILQKNREGIPQDLRDAAREKLTKERNVRENVIDFPFSPAQPNIWLIKKTDEREEDEEAKRVAVQRLIMEYLFGDK